MDAPKVHGMNLHRTGGRCRTGIFAESGIAALVDDEAAIRVAVEDQTHVGPVLADGSLRVVNRGYDADRKHWKEAVGRAEFIGAPDLGSLQVSFFGPFYGGYHVVELDPDYRWAIVAGPSRDYLWLLTRTQHAPTELVDRMIESAARLGFPTERLIRVDHRPVDAPAL